MEWSDEKKDIRGALFRAQGVMADPVKDGHNPHHGNRFPTLESVLAAVKPVLQAEGILLMQPFSVQPDGETQVITELCHVETDQWVRTSSSLRAAGKQVSHAAGGISTYIRRYQLMSLLALAPEDSDGNDAQAVVKERKEGRTPMGDLEDAARAAGVTLDDVKAYAAAHPKMRSPMDNPRGAARWLQGDGGATVRAWVIERDREAEPETETAAEPDIGEPEQTDESRFHPSFTPEDRVDFHKHITPVLYSKKHNRKHEPRWSEVKAYLAAHDMPHPGTLDKPGRVAFVGWLMDPDNRHEIAEWTAKVAADSGVAA